MGILSAALVFASCVLLCPAAGAKSLPLHRVSAEFRTQTSDERFVVFVRDPARPLDVPVFDSRLQRMKNLQVPTNCLGSELVRGQLLLTCSETDAASHIRVLNLASGELHAVLVRADPSVEQEVARAGFNQIGRYWYGGEYDACQGCNKSASVKVFVNKFTGEVRRYSPSEQSTGFDIDTPDLRPPPPGPICGIKRLFDYFDVDYRPPYLLYAVEPGLALRRCSRPRRSVTIACGLCEGPRLWSGSVTWSERSLLTLYVIKTRERYSWRFYRSGIFATRGWAFLVRPNGLFEARVPR
jgi:hypothetical protein